MFDLDDADAGALVGGEYVELQQDNFAAEGYAADVGQLADNTGMVNFGIVGVRTATALGGLADEGGEDYGTLFGSLIGQNTGKSTQFGTVNGAVVIGPTTDRASGKVTVWSQAGLYGVTDQDATLDTANANAAVHALVGTGLLEVGTSGGAQVAIYVGEMGDTSLVSTTNTAAGETAVAEYHAVFHLGNVN